MPAGPNPYGPPRPTCVPRPDQRPSARLQEPRTGTPLPTPLPAVGTTSGAAAHAAVSFNGAFCASRSACSNSFRRGLRAPPSTPPSTRNNSIAGYIIRITVANSPTSRSGSQLSTSSASDRESSSCAIASAPPDSLAHLPPQARSTKHAASAATPHPRSPARPFASPPLRSHLHSTPLPVPVHRVHRILSSSQSAITCCNIARIVPTVWFNRAALLQPLTNRLAHRIWLADQLSHRQPALQHRQRLTKTMQRHIDPLNQLHSTFLLHGLTHRQTPHSRDTHSPAPPSFLAHPSDSPRPAPSRSRAPPSSPSTLAAPSFLRR